MHASRGWEGPLGGEGVDSLDAADFKIYAFPLIFTKQLCDVCADELGRFPKDVGYLGGKHSRAPSEGVDFLVSKQIERSRACALKI